MCRRRGWSANSSSSIAPMPKKSPICSPNCSAAEGRCPESRSHPGAVAQPCPGPTWATTRRSPTNTACFPGPRPNRGRHPLQQAHGGYPSGQPAFIKADDRRAWIKPTPSSCRNAGPSNTSWPRIFCPPWRPPWPKARKKKIRSRKKVVPLPPLLPIIGHQIRELLHSAGLEWQAQHSRLNRFHRFHEFHHARTSSSGGKQRPDGRNHRQDQDRGRQSLQRDHRFRFL